MVTNPIPSDSSEVGRTPVKVGLVLAPAMRDLPENDLRAQLVRIADLGIDHVGVGDHVSFVGGAGFDGLIGASRLAAVEPRLPIYLAVYLLVLRHPVIVARQLATFASANPGRLIFGVGLGGEDLHELEICGIDPKTRGRRMNECLEVLRLLLAGRPVTYSGKFFQLVEALIQPAPRIQVPIVIGGRSDNALRRAGHFGDGWIGIWNSPRRFAAAAEIVQQAATKAGRVDVRFQHAMQLWCGFGQSPELARAPLATAMQSFYGIPFESFEKYSPSGAPEQVAEFLWPYVQAGCSTFNLIPVAGSTEECVEGVATVKHLLSGTPAGAR